MTFISKRILLPGMAAMAIGLGAVVPLTAEPAEARQPNCFMIGIAKGAAMTKYLNGDDFWFAEWMATEAEGIEHCGG